MSASGGSNVTLTYDPLGRLFQTTSATTGTTQFLYDGDALIGEYAGATMTRRYVHGTNAAAEDPLIWYEYTNGGYRRGLFTDHQGSVIAVTDMYGNPVAINAYDSWGIPNSANQGRFGYTGKAWIPELGMWHYKARIYSPTLGRFLQTDPVGYDDQMNLQAYAGNDPVNVVDPTGEDRVYCSIEVERDGRAYTHCILTPDNDDTTTVEYHYRRQNSDGSITEWTDPITYPASLSKSGLLDALVDALPFVDSMAQEVRDAIDAQLSEFSGAEVSIMNGRWVPAPPDVSAAGHGGTPGSNTRQNRVARDAANAEGLDTPQRERLKRELETLNRDRGEVVGYHEARDIARDIKAGRVW